MRQVGPSLLLLLGLLLGPTQADELVLPEASAELRRALDRALGHQLEGRWHEAIRTYGEIVVRSDAAGSLIPAGFEDPAPAVAALVSSLKHTPAKDPDPTDPPRIVHYRHFDGRPASLVLTPTTLRAASRLLEEGGEIALYRRFERSGPPSLWGRSDRTAILVSAHQYALRQLARLPAEGRRTYRRLRDPQVGARWIRAAQDPIELDRIASEEFLSTHGARAIHSLARRALEKGAFAEAEARWSELLRWFPTPGEVGIDPALVTAGLAFCHARTGRVRALRALQRQVQGPPGKQPIEIGGQTSTLEQFIGERLEEAMGQQSRNEVSMADISGPLEERWRVSLGRRIPPPIWRRSESGQREAEPIPFLPVVDESTVYVCGQTSLIAHDLLTGVERWKFEAGTRPWGRAVRLESPQDPLYQPRPAGEIVLAVFDRYTDITARAGAVPGGEPTTRLHAISSSTGQAVWSQPPVGDDAPEGVLSHTYLVGPPLVIDGRVFVAGTAAHRGIEIYLFAFDLYSGEPIWERFLCSSIRSDLPEDRAERPMAPLVAPLAAQGGRIFVATNVGVVAAIDAKRGQIVWLTRTDEYPGKSVQTLESDPRTRRFPALQAPVVRDDRLYVLPTDAGLGPLRVFDTETGSTEMIFETRSPNFDYRFLLGVDETGCAYLNGIHTLALRPDPDGMESTIAWRTPPRSKFPRARGGIGPQFLYDLGGKSDASVLFRLDRKNGKIVEEIARPDGRAFGNLLTIVRQIGVCAGCRRSRILDQTTSTARLPCPCGDSRLVSSTGRQARYLISVSDQEIGLLEGRHP